MWQGQNHDIRLRTKEHCRFVQTTWCYYPHPDEAYYHHTVDNNVISITFGIESDLSQLDREAMRAEYAARFPTLSDAQVRTLYSMLYHFTHTMQIGDRVIYPSTRHERVIRVGNCTGHYRHVPGDPLGCVHQHNVEWERTFDREEFSPEALMGISVNLVIFRVHNAIFLNELNQLMGSSS
jgi:predicted Mrr-cat superfamily restriction endonuclease